MRTLLALALIAVGSLPCSATVAVIYLDSDFLVIAADSRGQRAEGNSDDVCKIFTLGAEAVFVSSGALGYHREMEAAYWKIVSESGTVDRRLKDAAEEFAQTAANRFADLGQRNPREFERLRTVNGGGLLTAILAGQHLELFQIRIEGTPRNVTWEVMPVPSCGLQNFCVIGQVDTVIGQLSPDKPHSRMSPEVAIEKARELIETTRRAHPAEVGGPVDVVTLERDRVPVWRALKQACK